MQVLSVARDIGATHVCGILYSAFQKYLDPPTDAGIADSVDVLRRIGDEAAQHGITIGLEVVNRYETNVLNTAAQAVDFARRVALPNVKVHLDTYHMNIEEADLESALIDTGAMLGYFHIGESGRGYLGRATSTSTASSAASPRRATGGRSPSSRSRRRWSTSSCPASSASGATSGRTAPTSRGMPRASSSTG